MKKDDGRNMTTQDSGRKSLADLIREGGGLDGFDWPEEARDFEIRIGRDGTWYHQGSPIRRKRLCQVLATVLQRDAEGVYWLVTPGERGRIEVEDAPFLAVELAVEGRGESQRLSFRNSLDHWVTAGRDHPIRVATDPETGEPSPYVMFRDGLEALIARPVFYELVDLAEEREHNGRRVVGVTSGGAFFELGEAPQSV